MTTFNNPLDGVKIAAPCKADWEQMTGTDRVRFCGQCNLNVYNLSSMTKEEAETFIAGNEGRLCVKFYRRTDGSILTKDCPVGLRAVTRKISCLARVSVAAVLSFLAGIAFHQGALRLADEIINYQPLWELREDHVVMGEIAGHLNPRQYQKLPGALIKEGDAEIVPQRPSSRRKKGHASYK